MTVSWHFGVEEFVVVSLDMGNKGRAACQGERVTSAPGQVQPLEYDFCSNLYDPEIDISAFDIGLVECSCIPNVVKRLMNCFNIQTIGK